MSFIYFPFKEHKHSVNGLYEFQNVSSIGQRRPVYVNMPTRRFSTPNKIAQALLQFGLKVSKSAIVRCLPRMPILPIICFAIMSSVGMPRPRVLFFAAVNAAGVGVLPQVVPLHRGWVGRVRLVVPLLGAFRRRLPGRARIPGRARGPFRGPVLVLQAHRDVAVHRVVLQVRRALVGLRRLRRVAAFAPTLGARRAKFPDQFAKRFADFVL